MIIGAAYECWAGSVIAGGMAGRYGEQRQTESGGGWSRADAVPRREGRLPQPRFMDNLYYP